MVWKGGSQSKVTKTCLFWFSNTQQKASWVVTLLLQVLSAWKPVVPEKVITLCTLLHISFGAPPSRLSCSSRIHATSYLPLLWPLLFCGIKIISKKKGLSKLPRERKEAGSHDRLPLKFHLSSDHTLVTEDVKLPDEPCVVHSGAYLPCGFLHQDAEPL